MGYLYDYSELRFDKAHPGTPEFEYNQYLKNHALKQNKGARGTRDTERTKTYRSEWAYEAIMGAEIPVFRNIEEAQKFAKKIYKSKTWQKLWEDNSEHNAIVALNPTPSIVQKKKSSGRGTSGFTNGLTVTLDARAGLNAYVILHELSHCLGHMHHGRSFRKTLLALVGRFLGAEHKKVLQQKFKENKLAYGDARKPMGFEQWKSARDRMTKMRNRRSYE